MLYAENKRDLQLWLKALTHAACSGISRRVEPSGFRADGPDAEIRSHTTFIFSTSSLEARLRRCRSVSASLVKKSPAEASTESLAQSPPSPSSPLMSPCSPPQSLPPLSTDSFSHLVTCASPFLLSRDSKIIPSIKFTTAFQSHPAGA